MTVFSIGDRVRVKADGVVGEITGWRRRRADATIEFVLRHGAGERIVTDGEIEDFADPGPSVRWPD
jgi:hypothetical protein